MSLNCLTCQDLRRSNSGKEYGEDRQPKKICCIKVERSWSGNLSPPPYEKIGNGSVVVARKIKKDRRRLKSLGTIAFRETDEPKLVRSSGMRRDWSFEDLRQKTLEDTKECRAY